MTKGVILENLGEAQYRVKLEYNTDDAQDKITEIDNRLVQVAIELPIAQVELLDKQTEASDIQDDLNVIIDNANTEGRPVRLDEVEELINTIAQLGKEVIAAQFKVNQLIAERASLSKRKEYLEGLINQLDNVEGTFYCADYIDDLPVSAEVAVITVPGENLGNELVIKPAYEDIPSGSPGKGASWVASVDGQFSPSWNLSPSGNFYNQALLPGWQKWNPIYRYGTMQNKNGNICNVVLDAEVSSQQDLDVNQTAVLTNVPIDYMTCDGAAFEDGDRVVIYFTDNEWSNGVVVGFESSPKQCPGGFLCIPTSSDFPNGIGGAGAISLLTYTTGAATYNFTAVSNLLAHNVNWISASNQVISWRGSLARSLPPYRVPGSAFTPFATAPPGYSIGVPDPASEDSGVYQWAFIRFNTTYAQGGAFITGPGNRIVGAGIQKGSDEVDYLVMVTTDNSASPVTDYVHYRPANDTAAPWVQIASWEHPTKIGVHETGFFFNASGNEAVAVLKDFTPVAGSPLTWFNRVYVLQVDVDIPLASVAEGLIFDGLSKTTTYIATCDATPGSGEQENASNDTTEAYSGEQVLAVDYQGDTKVYCTHTLQGEDTRVEVYDANGVNFVTWDYQNGLRSIVDINGTEVDLYYSTELTSGARVSELGGDSSSYNETVTGELIETEFYYLDLRFDEALYLQNTRTFNQSRTIPVSSSVITQSINDSVTAELRFSSELTEIESGSYNIVELNIGSGTIGPDPFCNIDNTIDTVDITVEVDHGDNQGFQQIMQIDVYGNRFVSINNDINEDAFGSDGYINYLDDGDPVSLSGLTGDNPSFWPITLS